MKVARESNAETLLADTYTLLILLLIRNMKFD